MSRFAALADKMPSATMTTFGMISEGDTIGIIVGWTDPDGDEREMLLRFPDDPEVHEQFASAVVAVMPMWVRYALLG